MLIGVVCSARRIAANNAGVSPQALTLIVGLRALPPGPSTGCFAAPCVALRMEALSSLYVGAGLSITMDS